ncbi:MAG: pilin [Patescibacteria group bacterium]|nr:pilin [Patescibacteria group bacterium]
MPKGLIKNFLISIVSFLFFAAPMFFVQAAETMNFENACGEPPQGSKPACSGNVVKVKVGDMVASPNKGCTDGKQFAGCRIEGSDCVSNGVYQDCSAINVCCADQYKIGSDDQANCSQEDVVECGASAEALPPKGGLFSYKCVDPGACKGNIVAGANCPQGVSGKVCCQQARCVKSSSSAGGTATKPPSEFKLTNPLGNTTSIPVILGRIIKTFLGILGGIALMVFVYGGLMWMTARGDQSQVKKGQDALKAATIGLFIVIFSYTLAGYLVTALTSEQTIIAAEEGRATAEKPTEASNQAATVSSQLKEAEQKQQQGQAGAVQAGQSAGIPEQTSNCGSLKGQAYLDCISSSGQSLYNTPNPMPNLPGGQKDCKFAPDPNKCSTIGWKTICNEKVFDTGYGAYNKMSCATQSECTGKGGTIINTANFGNNCGAGSVCCKAP